MSRITTTLENNVCISCDGKFKLLSFYPLKVKLSQFKWCMHIMQEVDSDNLLIRVGRPPGSSALTVPTYNFINVIKKYSQKPYENTGTTNDF